MESRCAEILACHVCLCARACLARAGIVGNRVATKDHESQKKQSVWNGPVSARRSACKGKKRWPHYLSALAVIANATAAATGTAKQSQSEVCSRAQEACYQKAFKLLAAEQLKIWLADQVVFMPISTGGKAVWLFEAHLCAGRSYSSNCLSQRGENHLACTPH